MIDIFPKLLCPPALQVEAQCDEWVKPLASDGLVEDRSPGGCSLVAYAAKAGQAIKTEFARLYDPCSPV